MVRSSCLSNRVAAVVAAAFALAMMGCENAKKTGKEVLYDANPVGSRDLTCHSNPSTFQKAWERTGQAAQRRGPRRGV